jgi:hypothetical protein
MHNLMQPCKDFSVVAYLQRVMGLNTNLAPLPRWSPTTTTSVGAVNELLVIMSTMNMLLELIAGVANLLHLMWVYIMEKELMCVAMAPGVCRKPPAACYT